MEYLLLFLGGILLGAIAGLIFYRVRQKETRTIAQELISQLESQRAQELEALINRIKDAFGALSLEALSRNTQEFLRLANETLSRQTQLGEKELEEKKKLIDQTLEAMRDELLRIQEQIANFEKDREKKFGELSNQLRATVDITGKLQETTQQLRTALSSSKARGQWGERMAEDVLRAAGFIEGINYIKQTTMDTVRARPDYTFLLPQNLKLNMDVKFPLDNYLRYLEEEGENNKEKYKLQFLKDVRNRIKEVTTREYINPEENTVDYVLVFIPNEQVYSFIHENDQRLLDEALKNKVILCSPITLYAILAIIRQAIDTFNLEQTAGQILSLLGAFYKQWDTFLKSLEKMGKKLDEAKEEFNRLTSTRRNQLERLLQQIEDLRIQRGEATPLAIDEIKILQNNADELEQK